MLSSLRPYLRQLLIILKRIYKIKFRFDDGAFCILDEREVYPEFVEEGIEVYIIIYLCKPMKHVELYMKFDNIICSLVETKSVNHRLWQKSQDFEKFNQCSSSCTLASPYHKSQLLLLWIQHPLLHSFVELYFGYMSIWHLHMHRNMVCLGSIRYRRKLLLPGNKWERQVLFWMSSIMKNNKKRKL